MVLSRQDRHHWSLKHSGCSSLSENKWSWKMIMCFILGGSKASSVLRSQSPRWSRVGKRGEEPTRFWPSFSLCAATILFVLDNWGRSPYYSKDLWPWLCHNWVFDGCSTGPSGFYLRVHDWNKERHWYPPWPCFFHWKVSCLSRSQCRLSYHVPVENTFRRPTDVLAKAR